MPEVLVLNPRNKRTGRFTRKTYGSRGKFRRRRRNPIAAVAANPRRRRRRRNPSARRRRVMGYAVGPAKIRRRKLNARRARVRRRRRNPRGMGNLLSLRGLTSTLVPAVSGAAGALGLDVALSYIPLPAALQTPLMRNVTRVVGALALGAGAGMIFSRRTGYMVATGALTVAAYGALRDFVATNVPALQVSGISPPMYNDYSDTRIGYVSPSARLSAYMSPGAQVPGNTVGAYMRDSLDPVNSLSGTHDGM